MRLCDAINESEELDLGALIEIWDKGAGLGELFGEGVGNSLTDAESDPLFELKRLPLEKGEMVGDGDSVAGREELGDEEEDSVAEKDCVLLLVRVPVSCKVGVPVSLALPDTERVSLFEREELPLVEGDRLGVALCVIDTE